MCVGYRQRHNQITYRKQSILTRAGLSCPVKRLAASEQYERLCELCVYCHGQSCPASTKEVSMETMLIDASSVHMRNRRSKHNTGQDTRSGTC